MKRATLYPATVNRQILLLLLFLFFCVVSVSLLTGFELLAESPGHQVGGFVGDVGKTLCLRW